MYRSHCDSGVCGLFGSEENDGSTAMYFLHLCVPRQLVYFQVLWGWEESVEVNSY